MRKLLLFVLVFGAGLSLLIFLAYLRNTRRSEELPVEEPGQTTVEGGEQMVPIPGEEEGATKGYVAFDGPMEYRGFDPDAPQVLPTYHFVARDVDHVEEDEHELHDIALDIYDPDTGNVRATLKAVRGRARLQLAGSEAKVRQEEPARLWDVELTLLEEAPFVPLTLYVPVLDVDLDERTFVSDTAVRLEGSGMKASSLGLVVRESEGLVRLVEEGDIDLWIEDETHAQLLATGSGPIDLLRDMESGGDELSVVASEGARLVLEGREPLRSDSDHLTIRGRLSGEEGSQRFLPREALAVGNAVLRRGPDVFEGQRALFEFTADGSPRQAQLSGEPLASVWVDAAADEREPARRVRIDLTGAGPLVAGFHPSTGFEMGGPGRIEVEAFDLEVTAAESIAGEIDRDGNTGRVWLRGAVDARAERASFQGPSLDLVFRREAGGESVVVGTSPGPTHMEWEGENGRRVEIDTQGEVEWIAEREDLRVPLAREAHVRVEGPDGFEARAGLLQDFRRSTQSFEAREDVEYATASGTGRAVRVLSRGPDHATFFGTPEAPATFELGGALPGEVEHGSLRALRVERFPERATAEGQVELDLRGPQGEHELRCAWLEIRSPLLSLEAADDEPHPFRVVAQRVTRGEFRGELGQGGFRARELEITGRFLPREAATQDAQQPAEPAAPAEEVEQGGLVPQRIGRAEIEQLEARGAVQIDIRREERITGQGERFVWSPDGGARLEGGRGTRARAWARLAGSELPYRISAEWVEFDERHVDARWPRITLDRPEPDPDAERDNVLIGASAEWMSADEEGVLFSGLAHLVGRLESGEGWRLNAGSVHLLLETQAPAEPGGDEAGASDAGALAAGGALRSIVAWDGFDVQVGEETHAAGELLEADFRVLRMEGAPAQMDMLGFVLESAHIEYDVQETLMTTDPGRVTGKSGSGFEGWTLEYESLEPRETLDSTMLVVRNPRLSNEEGRELRAGWALLWVDRDRWQDRTQGALRGVGEGPVTDSQRPAARQAGAEEEAPAEPTRLFGKIPTAGISEVLTEIYIEDEVEYLQDGERSARMDALYVDVVDGHGWLKNAEVYINIASGDTPARLVARAEWMRHSADGTLHSDSATIASCDFAKPHLFVETRDLQVTLEPEGEEVFRVRVRKNSLKLSSGLGIPLPPLSYRSDRDFRPLFDNLSFGSSARFGQFVGATVEGGLGAAGGALSKAVGGDKEDVDGRVRYQASWLGSRGFLLGSGLDAEIPGKLWTFFYADAIPDRGEDKGLVRVPEDERPGLRYYLRGRARYMLTEREWIDFAFNHQSDAGVQSEFYESQFLLYEERDNYIHWRKAEDTSYRSITAAVRLDDFRNYIERLPEALIYEGLKPIALVYGFPLMYTTNNTAGLIRRREGYSPFSPFDPSFSDGLGSRDVARVDTAHRFEVPISLRHGGWRLAPFASVRGTFWSESADEVGATVRGDLFAGLEASSNYLRVGSDGLANSFTPTIGVRGDLASLQDGSAPVPIDEVEFLPREGLFVDLGLRTQIWKVGSRNRFSLDLRGTHGSGLEGAPDGWLPIAVLASLETAVNDMPVFLVHDGRYDPDQGGETVFSRWIAGWAPFQTFGLEGGLHSAKNDLGARLYDAASLGARWRATEKWELEAFQTVNLFNGTALASAFTLRRYGHDFVFDLVLSQRSAEGATIGFSIQPLLGYRRSTLGRVDHWID